MIPITMIVVMEMASTAKILNTIVFPFSWVNGLFDECIPWLSIMGFERPKRHATQFTMETIIPWNLNCDTLKNTF